MSFCLSLISCRCSPSWCSVIYAFRPLMYCTFRCYPSQNWHHQMFEHFKCWMSRSRLAACVGCARSDRFLTVPSSSLRLCRETFLWASTIPLMYSQHIRPVAMMNAKRERNFIAKFPILIDYEILERAAFREFPWRIFYLAISETRWHVVCSDVFLFAVFAFAPASICLSFWNIT